MALTIAYTAYDVAWDAQGHPLHMYVRGTVPRIVRTEVLREISHILRDDAPGTIHYVAVTLVVDENPAVRYGAEAHIDVDVDGRLVHARGAAPTIREAADFVLHRFRARVARARLPAIPAPRRPSDPLTW